MTAGYSGTPLWKKLGMKSGQKIYLYRPPDNYPSLVHGIPGDIRFLKSVQTKIDIVHIFARSSAELRKAIEKYRYKIKDDGAIWVSWYKKAAKIPTDVTEDIVREVCLPLGLVDIKVCAVDEKWSGLKLVIRKEKRKSPIVP